jgi:uncharacterized protein YutE (UPF0331/DUF86 family)
MTDVVLGKIASLQRCVERAREIYFHDPLSFSKDFDRQDASVLNVIRACELAIDLANLMIKTYKMGIPKSSADSFALIHGKGAIPKDLEARLEKMVGFRNISVHEYTALDIEIVASVITKGLDDLVRFTDHVRKYIDDHPS